MTETHPKTLAVNQEQQQASKDALLATYDWLVNTFPAAFTFKRYEKKPLKIGIIKDIIDYLEKNPTTDTSKTKVRLALVTYTRQKNYIMTLTENATRIDLDGNDAGIVTKEEAESAIKKLSKKIKKFKGARRSNFSRQGHNRKPTLIKVKSKRQFKGPAKTFDKKLSLKKPIEATN